MINPMKKEQNLKTYVKESSVVIRTKEIRGQNSIIKKIIPEKAYDLEAYNAFTYTYTLVKETSLTKELKIPVGMWYHGSHGSDDLKKNKNIEDGYWQSSTDKDFKRLFADPDPKFQLEINEVYDDYTEASDAETAHLKRLNAKNDPMSWNKHNGFSSYSIIDRQACREMVEEIQKREASKYPISYEDKLIHKEMGSTQPREKDDKKHVKDIKTRINDKQGNVRLDTNLSIDPIVVFEERGAGGEDMRIDGNHLFEAINDSTSKAIEVPTIRIPLEDHEKFSADEVQHMGGMLNAPEDDKVTKKTSVLDATKFLFDYSRAGKHKYDTKVNRKLIREDYKLSSDQVNKVMGLVKDRVYEKEQNKLHRVYVDYNTADKENFVAKIKEEHPDTIVFYASAGMTTKIPHMIFKAIEQDYADAKCGDDRLDEKGDPIPYLDIIFCVHFAQSKALRDGWRKTGWRELSEQFNLITRYGKTEALKYKLDYAEFPLTRVDTK